MNSLSQSQPVSALLGAECRPWLSAYDAGLLNDFGGGDVSWWQDYLRAELEHAHDFYQVQIEAVAARCRSLVDALTPSADTKAAYIGEIKFTVSTGFEEDGCEVWQDITVPWTTIKDIMAMVLAYTASDGALGRQDGPSGSPGMNNPLPTPQPEQSHGEGQ